jgi:hypothetical protein
MSLQHWQYLSEELYKLRRYELLKQLEDNGDPKVAPSVNCRGIATLSIPRQSLVLIADHGVPAKNQVLAWRQ